MASLNKAILLGNMTRDPEMRMSQSGIAVCNFGLAINEKTKSGEKTIFVDVTCFQKLAEIVNQYCQKGKQVVVEGRIAQDQWQDKQTGAKRSKMYVVADNVVFFGGKDQRRPDAHNEAKQNAYQPNPPKQMTNGTPDDASEIPF